MDNKDPEILNKGGLKVDEHIISKLKNREKLSLF